MPALSVQQPPSVLEQYGKVMQLRNLGLQQQQFQQQESLFPGQQELQKAQITGANQQNQIGANQVKLSDIEVKDQQLLSTLYPQFTKKTPTNGSPTASDTGPVGYDFEGLKKKFIDSGGSFKGLNQINGIQSQNAELTTKLAGADEAARKNQQSINSAMNDAIETLQAIPDLQARKQALPGILGNLQKLGVDTSKLSQVDPSDENLAKAQATLGMHQQVIEDATKLADLQKAQQGADPVLKLSTPEALAAPGAKASIQTLIEDPKTKPEDIPRLQALIPKAQIAQDQVILQKKRELRAQQLVTQGDPDAAGKLLANRSLTLDELKVRQATPEFIEKAVLSAQKYDPNFKAPEAAAQAAIAKSPQNQMFFGNTDSLLVAGGTLDQLAYAGKNLKNTQLPVWNTVENLVSASLGKGPIAAYAAAVLNVADDQAKVMGGTGAATDTSRKQSLDLFAKNMSPEALEASINQVRQGVLSQRRGRAGVNPYLNDMYPEPKQSGAASQAGMVNMKAPDGTIKPIPADQVEHYKSKGATIVP